jgi:thiol:disulfide interchange protein DsbC
MAFTPSVDPGADMLRPLQAPKPTINDAFGGRFLSSVCAATPSMRRWISAVHNRRMKRLIVVARVLLLAPLLAAQVVWADPNAATVPKAVTDALRAAFAQQFPSMPAVDEVRGTPIAGLYELRVGSDIFYSTARAEYVIQGDLIEGRTGASLTQRRIHQLSAIDPASLSPADAVTWTRGRGERRVFVFADPNCGPCKLLEAELGKIDNLSVHTFIVPVLGGDSPKRARDLWCSSDRAAAWRSWMLEAKAPAAAREACNTQAIERNLALVTRYRIRGTPTMVLANGARVGGVPSAERLERELAQAER